MTVNLAVFATLLGGCHFCADEANALFLMLPGAGLVLNWVRSRIRLWRHRHVSEETCVHRQVWPSERISIHEKGT